MNQIILIIVFIFTFLFQINSFAYKPYNDLQIENADLQHYPQKIGVHEPGVEITIGDLHGNALKLLYFLIRNDVLHIPKSDYKLFESIYKKEPEKLTTKDLAFFHAILNAASIKTEHRIRFLGDDLCDRGMNDYYTLHIYKKLDISGAPFEIVLSNHGNFFLSAYERPEQSFSYNPYGEGVYEPIVQSMLHLGVLIDRGLVDKQETLDLIQTHYLKHIVLPGYTLNKKRNEITLYSHAPIDVTMLAALAKDLNIPFNDANSKELTKSLDEMSSQISQWIMSRTFTAHYNELNDAHKKAGTLSPLKQVLWNRDYNLLNREHRPEDKPYSINYVHGHDSVHNVFDLDNKFGKGPNHNKGPYAIYVTHP